MSQSETERASESELAQQNELSHEAELDQSVDTLLGKIGGFGRHQWFLTWTFICKMHSVNLLCISLAFLQKVPREYFCIYEGQEEESVCTPADFCGNPLVVSFKPNMALEDSYDNFIVRYDLHCAAKSEIGLIGSSFFIGSLISLTALPRFSDLNGRQNILMAGSIFDFLALTILLISKSYSTMILAMVMLGITAAERVQVGVNYMYESMERQHYRSFYTLIAASQGLIGIFATIYFMFIGKSSFWIVFLAFCMVGAATLSIFFLQESPRYLVKSGQLSQAFDSFEHIAKANSTEMVSEQEFIQLFDKAIVKKDLEKSSDDQLKQLDATNERTGLLTEEDQQNNYSSFRASETINRSQSVLYYLRQKRIFVNLIAMTVILASVSFNFYMQNFQIKYLPGNFQVNMLVVSMTDVFAALISGYIAEMYSVKNQLFTYTIVPALASFGLLFVDQVNPDWRLHVLLVLARAGVKATFSIIYISHQKYFPTLFAVTSLGMASLASQFAVIFAPFVAETSFPTPIIFLLVLQLAASIGALFMMDKQKVPLPLDDEENNQKEHDSAE